MMDVYEPIGWQRPSDDGDAGPAFAETPGNDMPTSSPPPLEVASQEELMEAHAAYAEAVRDPDGHAGRHVGAWYMDELLKSRSEPEVLSIMDWHVEHDRTPDPMLVQERYLIRSGVSPTELLWMWELYRNGTLSVTDLILGMADRGVTLNETQCEALLQRLLVFTPGDRKGKINPEKFASGLKRYMPAAKGSLRLGGATPMPMLQVPGRLPLGKLDNDGTDLNVTKQPSEPEDTTEDEQINSLFEENMSDHNDGEVQPDSLSAVFEDDEPSQEQREAAATTIAAHYRGHVARNQAKQLKMQQHLEDVKQADAATVISAAYRGHLARVQFKQKKKESDSATKIAAHYRAYAVRRDIAKRHEAATTIVAHYRGYRARQELNQKQEERHIAQTRIAANFRGYKVRKEFAQKQQKTQAVAKIAAHYRGFKARKGYQQMRDSATKIASVYRGYKARRDTDEMKKRYSLAQVRIAAAYRGHKARLSYARQKRERAAATTIAAHYRGHLERKSLKRKQQVNAANVISAHYRGYKARQNFKVQLAESRATKLARPSPSSPPLPQISREPTAVQKEAVTTIAKHYRGYKARIAYEELKRTPRPVKKVSGRRSVEVETQTIDNFEIEDNISDSPVLEPIKVTPPKPKSPPKRRKGESLIDYLERRVTELEADTRVNDPSFIYLSHREATPPAPSLDVATLTSQYLDHTVIVSNPIPATSPPKSEVRTNEQAVIPPQRCLERIDERLQFYEATMLPTTLPPPISVVSDTEYYRSPQPYKYVEPLPEIGRSRPVSATWENQHEIVSHDDELFSHCDSNMGGSEISYDTRQSDASTPLDRVEQDPMEPDFAKIQALLRQETRAENERRSRDSMNGILSPMISQHNDANRSEPSSKTHTTPVKSRKRVLSSHKERVAAVLRRDKEEAARRNPVRSGLASKRLSYDVQRRLTLKNEKEQRASLAALKRIEQEVGPKDATYNETQWEKRRLVALAKHRSQRLSKQVDIEVQTQRSIRSDAATIIQDAYRKFSARRRERDRAERERDIAERERDIAERKRADKILAERERVDNDLTKKQRHEYEHKKIRKSKPSERDGVGYRQHDQHEETPKSRHARVGHRDSMYERSQRTKTQKDKWIQERRRSAERKRREDYTFHPKINRGTKSPSKSPRSKTHGSDDDRRKHSARKSPSTLSSEPTQPHGTRPPDRSYTSNTQAHSLPKEEKPYSVPVEPRPAVLNVDLGERFRNVVPHMQSIVADGV